MNLLNDCFAKSSYINQTYDAIRNENERRHSYMHVNRRDGHPFEHWMEIRFIDGFFRPLAIVYVSKNQYLTNSPATWAAIVDGRGSMQDKTKPYAVVRMQETVEPNKLSCKHRIHHVYSRFDNMEEAIATCQLMLK